MEVVLIQPPSNCVKDDRVEPPLGLLYIASVLRENGHDVAICDMSGKNIADVIEGIPKADVYGISIVCSTHNFAKRIIKKIREDNHESFIVAGGPNPSALPERTLEDLCVDAVIVGEGEDAMVNLVRRDTLQIVLGKGRENIDSYPFPARDLVDLKTYTKRLQGEPTVSMITSRGCINNCLHCNSNVMGGGSRQPRYRSVGSIMDELTQLLPYSIRFSDDNFTSNPRLEELLCEMAKEDVKFRIFGRVDDLDDRICEMLREAGCVHVAVGMESLNPDNLRMIGKGSMIGSHGNLEIAKKHGLVIRATFIVGLPYDNDENIEYYFKKASELPFDEFEVYPLIPFPGTRVSQDPGRWGYRIVDDDFTKYVLVGRNRRTTFALEHENFGTEDVMRWRDNVSELFEEKQKISFGRSSVT